MNQYAYDEEVQAVRSNDFAIQPLILSRWSPRAFLDKTIPEEEVLAVLEAARWAPSCFNEQPWRFIVARNAPDREKLQGCLNEANRIWATQAPVLIAVLSNPLFAMDQRTNRWHEFDAGTAWGYLALEAHARGLVAHAMGGFSVKAVREKFQVPENWGVHAVIALGYRGPAEKLPAELIAREHPSERKPLAAIWAEGKFDF